MFRGDKTYRDKTCVKSDSLAARFVTISVVTKCSLVAKHAVTKRVKFDTLAARFITISVVTKRAVVTKHAVTKRVKSDTLAARFVTISVVTKRSVVTKGDKMCRGDKTGRNRSAAK